MQLKNPYMIKVFEDLKKRDPDQPEFLQAVSEVFESCERIIDQHPEIERDGILERITEPERVITFRVSWMDDQNKVRVNRGYRVQFNSSIGPYKGGLRLHPSVNLSVIKFLGFEQCFKNALTGLPMGGGKGGSDFDPKGKSDREIMHFCQSFMTELSRHIGQFIDVPAGDIGVGAREIGFMFGQYKRMKNEVTGTLTGKGLQYGGSLVRKEATGYGLCYFIDEMLNAKNETFEGKRVSVSGSGNVAIYTVEKAQQLGAKVLTISDSNGYVYDASGINLETLKKIKEVDRSRISEYVKYHPKAIYKAEGSIWDVPCDIALPCATENELDEKDAKTLIKNGCRYVGEGANMPCTPAAIHLFINSNVFYAPGKAANAGGVATSGLEMSQNSIRLQWSFDEVDEKLHDIMRHIYKSAADTAEKYGHPGNLELGSNISALLRLSEAMTCQGVSW